MLRKTMAIVLSIVLLLTLCPTMGVFATLPTDAGTLKITHSSPYTTGNGVKIVNFNGETPSDTAFCYASSSDSAHAGSDGEGGTIYDGLFHTNGSSSNSNTFVTGENADGTQSVMLRVRPTTAGLNRLVVYTGNTSGETVMLEYDIIFDNIPDTQDWINVNHKSYGVGFGPNSECRSYGMNLFGTNTESVTDIESISTKKSYNIVENKWYKVCMYKDANGKSTQYLKDAITGEIYLYSYGNSYSARQELYLYLLGALKNNDITDYPIFRIDNVKLTSFMANGFSPAVVKWSIENNKTDVKPNDIITATFDQPMDTDAVIATFTDDKDRTITGTVTSACETYCNNQLNIMVPVDVLGSTNYTLSLTGANEGGAILESNSITFKTEASGIVKISENFDVDKRGNYNNSAWNNTGWSVAATDNSVSPLTMVRLVNDTVFTDVGYNGNALKIVTLGEESSNGNIRPLYTSVNYTLEKNPDNAAENEKMVVTYRINIKDMADFGTTFSTANNENVTTKGTDILIGADNSSSLTYTAVTAVIRTNNEGKLYVANAGESGPVISENRWYNIIWTIDGQNQTFEFVDTTTGKTVFTTKKTIDVSAFNAEDGICIIPFSGAKTVHGGTTSIFNQNQTVLIDDFTIWKIKPWEAKHKLALESEPTVNNNQVSFTFNQPVVAKMGMFDVTKGNDEKAYLITNVKGTDFCSNEISFTNIEAGETYTVDYSDITGISGTAFADSTAKTKSFTVAGLSENTTVSVEATGANVGDTVSFDFWAEEAGNVTFVAAFYDNAVTKELVGIETVTESVSVGKNEKTITLEADYGAKAQEVAVFAWSDLTGLTPVAENTAKIPCADTLKVLLIGNSLSEDAQRHLNNVASLGGLTLDLTVAGIGGSDLAHHKTNLEAELGGRTVDEAKAEIDRRKAENPDAAESTTAGEDTRLLYWTYKNGVSVGNAEQRLLDILKADTYDVISFQQFDKFADSDFSENLPSLAQMVRQLQPNAELVLYEVWSGPYANRSTRSAKITDTIAPANEKWAAQTPKLVSGITKGNIPMTVIPAGTAFYIADEMYPEFGETLPSTTGDTNSGTQSGTSTEEKFARETSLWRDANHASYYGCYLADAVWFECLTGRIAPVGTISSPAVPKPDSISEADHFAKLEKLRDIAHSVVLAER